MSDFKRPEPVVIDPLDPKFGDLIDRTFRVDMDKPHGPENRTRATGVFLGYHEGFALVRYRHVDLPAWLTKDKWPTSDGHVILGFEAL